MLVQTPELSQGFGSQLSDWVKHVGPVYGSAHAQELNGAVETVFASVHIPEF